MVNNEIDITHLGPDTGRVAVEQNPKITTHAGRRAPYGYTDWWPQSLWVNHDVPPFDNADVRWGLSYLIDREKAIELAWEGNNMPNPMPWPPYAGLQQYTEHIAPLLEVYDTNEYSPEKAAERLTSAGYSQDGDGMWVDGSVETLKVPIESWLQWDVSAQVVVEQLKRGGIDASFTTPPDAWDRFISGEYLVFPAGHAGSLKEPYETMNLYRCPDEFGTYLVANYSHWCNEDFDAIVQQMAETSPADVDKMKDLTYQAAEIWLPDLPDIQLWNWMHNFGMNETYWTNWPTVDNEKDGEYVNEASQLLGFHIVLIHLEPAQ
jgi:peptide/nickel transport system substrate-binding protein